MAQSQPTDDVIRIRIDTTRAVDAFLCLLAEQAAEGETREPANPAATAIWRELAPFRLVEYAYIDESVGPIDGAYVGFPNGMLYAVEEDIPDRAVTDLISAGEHRLSALPPLYVYVPLRQPIGIRAIESFLTELSAHIGHSLVGVLPDSDERMVARVFDSEGTRAATAETDRHLGKRDILERFGARSRRSDGRAYAVLTLSFARHVLEFANTKERDAFIVWSHYLCDWIFANGGDAAALGFAELCRPAEIAPAPDNGCTTVRLGLVFPPIPAPPEGMREAWIVILRAIGGSATRP
ncbi:hypothetical protein [Magnetospirillum molischianum]|uniref:Uncharacterized protein n=1 Tax=Magnetospirillum molischianum DSM 120 TaxID=1150626 RepID=H8FRD8_MAGML|nr:hypothetical protein [Magnetospirillum molischianum]CCG40926.1 conserved hypothetical protein [Magnetospirillum molischianum DSM 120]